MAYHQGKLDAYRAALQLPAAASRPAAAPLRVEEIGDYRCATCPYCNGERDARVKHLHPSTKTEDRWAFWQHVMVSKFRRLQSSAALANLKRTFIDPLTQEPKANKMFTVGPMVDQSELPFRLLCREFGATLTYTPMLHAKSFAESHTYRKQFLTVSPVNQVVRRCSAPEPHETEQEKHLLDRPVVVQFCGCDADTVLQAARHAVCGEDSAGQLLSYSEKDGERYYQCDAVDLNLGCPQGIARRGHYGAFLMEEWDVIHTIVHTLHVELEVPVTAKMRVFDDANGELDEALTIAYAKMLRDAGAAVICIHGRTRAMKGQFSGLADMNFVRRIREALGGSVPVISNGNVLDGEDVLHHLTHVGGEGHMCAEPLLWDPALFANRRTPVPSGRLDRLACKAARLAAVNTAERYLEYVRHSPVPLGFVKAHLFKMCYHSYELHVELREELSVLSLGAGTGRFHEELASLVAHVRQVRQVEEASQLVESQAKTGKAEKKRQLLEAQGEETRQFNFFEDCGEEPLGFTFDST